jgi:hypothetical protein
LAISARELNRSTLERQLLLARERLPIPEALHRVLALQAQEPASPYLALWNRVDGFDAKELDAAFADGQIVKASLMRVTLHAVTAADYLPFQAAMRPSLRASRLNDRRFTGSGLTSGELDAYEPRLLAASTGPRSGPQLIEALQEPFGELARNAWWAYRTYAPLHHAPTGGPWSFGLRPSFIAAPRTLPPEEHEAGVERLVLRYLRAFGPATVADVARFTLLTRMVVRDALRRLDQDLVRLEGAEGAELFDVSGAGLPGEVPAPPRMLPMWESSLLAYADGSRIVPLAYRSLVTRRNGDVLPTVLVDGYVAGVWRPSGKAIEVTAFERLPEDQWAALAHEAAALLPLLADRDPQVYRGYRRWWDGLPAVEARLLPG